MKKRAISWKENKIISIETRKNIFVIAQMLKSPYIRFYNCFGQDEKWDNIQIKDIETLFTNPVTKQFLKFSNISEAKNIAPDLERKDNNYWIEGLGETKKMKLWQRTENEIEFITLNGNLGGRLIYKDITKGGKQDKKIIKDNIPLNDTETIDNHELTGLAVSPLTNERLYLCYKAGKNVNPHKDLQFGREIPLRYKNYFDLGKVLSEEEKNKLLELYK